MKAGNGLKRVAVKERLYNHDYKFVSYQVEQQYR